MSTNINANLLKQFIIKQVGTEMTMQEAQKLGVENHFEAAVTEAEKDELNFNEILLDQDLYEDFAVMYTTEQEQKATAKDKDKEKEEQTAVKNKNGAGV